MSKRLKHHFVPDKTTRQRAVLLRPGSFLLYSIALIVMAFSISFSVRVVPGVLGYSSSIRVAELLTATNKIREEHGLSPLVLNRSLTTAAENKAHHMFNNNYWAHISPDGTEPWSFILNENYDYTYAGENLAKNFNDSGSVVDAWYKSPTHRDNLLNPNYDEVGFAVSNGVLEGYQTTLVVQMFGRPRDLTQISTAQDQEEILASYDDLSSAKEVPNFKFDNDFSTDADSVVIDVSKVTRYLSVLFVSFILLLLSVDIWYTRKHDIPKFNGHTIAHILYLVVILVSLLFVINPGRVL